MKDESDFKKLLSSLIHSLRFMCLLAEPFGVSDPLIQMHSFAMSILSVGSVYVKEWNDARATGPGRSSGAWRCVVLQRFGTLIPT